jgi:hypothetical protein
MCRSPSQSVRTSPARSAPVAVLSCCTGQSARSGSPNQRLTSQNHQKLYRGASQGSQHPIVLHEIAKCRRQSGLGHDPPPLPHCRRSDIRTTGHRRARGYWSRRPGFGRLNARICRRGRACRAGSCRHRSAVRPQHRRAPRSARPPDQSRRTGYVERVLSDEEGPGEHAPTRRSARWSRSAGWHGRRARLIVMTCRFCTVPAVVRGKLRLGRVDRPVRYFMASRSSRQCSWCRACRWHSSPQLLQMATQACSSGLVTLAS